MYKNGKDCHGEKKKDDSPNCNVDLNCSQSALLLLASATSLLCQTSARDRDDKGSIFKCF